MLKQYQNVGPSLFYHNLEYSASHTNPKNEKNVNVTLEIKNGEICDTYTFDELQFMIEKPRTGGSGTNLNILRSITLVHSLLKRRKPAAGTNVYGTVGNRWVMRL